MTNKILIVEDELIVAGDIRLTLERAGNQVCGVARSYGRALEIIDFEKPSLVLLDMVKSMLTMRHWRRWLCKGHRFLYQTMYNNRCQKMIVTIRLSICMAEDRKPAASMFCRLSIFR